MRKLSSTLFVACLFSYILAWAWPPTYGAEFEFTHRTLHWGNEGNRSTEAFRAKALYLSTVEKFCANLKCKTRRVNGKWGDQDYKITFPDGWWFKISHDPNVVEITTKPSTLAQLQARADLINKIIFTAGEKSGFSVDARDTAHFNFGAKSAFGDDARAFMRFFVDYQNHIELSLGALGMDLDNAPPLSVLGEDQREALSRLIARVEAGEYDKGTGSEPVGRLASDISMTVYTKSFNPSWGGERHYQALGLKYVNPHSLQDVDRPIEMRAVWSQENAEKFIKIAELVQARIKFLKGQTGPIRYLQSARESIDSATELKTRFRIYVEEAGLDFERFKDLMPVRLRNATEEAFLDPRKPLRQRLLSMVKYVDLYEISPLFRGLAKDLAAQGLREGVSVPKSIRDRIDNNPWAVSEQPASRVRGAGLCREALL